MGLVSLVLSSMDVVVLVYLSRLLLEDDDLVYALLNVLLCECLGLWNDLVCLLREVLFRLEQGAVRHLCGRKLRDQEDATDRSTTKRHSEFF
jgi:hypothetical protein